ncbi:MAG: hypothetical protein K0S45_3303 [Nitrospira sp.]|jgi:hypothetical protein|nr:hypothetical protein [Nitrospira sp.]
MTPDVVLAAMPLAGLCLLVILPVILIRIWKGRTTAPTSGRASETSGNRTSQRKGLENSSMQGNAAVQP